MCDSKIIVPRWVAILAALLCFAAVTNLPYGFYKLLRWVVCGVSFSLAYQSHNRGRLSWVWIFAFVAVIFSPVFRMPFEREVWRVFNVIAGVALIAGSRGAKKEN
jgi:hypothetical protein